MSGMHSQPVDTNNPQPNQILGPYYNVGLGHELNAHNGNNIYQLTNGGGMELVGTVPTYVTLNNSGNSSPSSSSSGSGSSNVLSNLSTTDYVLITGAIVVVILLL